MRRLRALLFIFLICLSAVFISSCRKEPESTGKVTAIRLSKSNIVFDEVNQSITIKAYVVPSDALDQTVTWTSSNSSIAICQDGKITAVDYGVCVIRATASSGASAACTVRVGEQNPSLKISESELELSDVGVTHTLVAYTRSIDVPTENVTWTSSNEAVIKCGAKGEIEAVGYGVCVVKAKTKNGKEAECTVVVENPNEPYCYISEKSHSLSAVDEEFTLFATVSNDISMPIRWISSNEKVARVTAGVVRAMGEGSCAIVAIAENGMTAACAVTVGESQKEPTGYEDRVTFDVPNLPTTVKYINRKTMQVESMAMILGYEVSVVEGVEGIEKNELGLIVKLKCVKVYDKNGAEGKSTTTFTASVYRDDGIFCYKEAFTNTQKKIGNEYTVTMRMKVTVYEGVDRHFYIEFPHHILAYV